MSTGTGVWAYAVTEQARLTGPDGEVDLSWLSGVGDTGVRTITCSGLTVLASDVRLAESGEAAPRENLESQAWLEEAARLHHYVVDAAARLVPLLPVRLATVYRSDAAACAVLAGHHDQLLDALHRVGGRVEWGVRAYAASRDEAASTPAGWPGNGGSGDGTGLAYLTPRRGQFAAGREARAMAVQGARTVHAGLAGKAAAAMVHPRRSAQLSGTRPPMLLNAAYLLDTGGGPDFTVAVAAEATAHPELRIELTGPWPPYSFAGDGNDKHSESAKPSWSAP